MSIFDELVSEEPINKQSVDIILEGLKSLDCNEARDALAKLKRFTLGLAYEPEEGWVFPNEHKPRYSTTKGVEEQLVDFKGPVGLLYLFTFFDNKLDLVKISVVLSRAKFKYVKAYQTEE